MKQQRHNRILEMLDEKGSVSIAELTETLGVSGMTARRDLDQLATAGLLRRHHGGAVRNLGRSFEPPFRARAERSEGAKDAIGRCAAAMVSSGDAIGIDVGTTVLAMVRHLQAPNITIVTTGLRVAMEVATHFALEQDLRVIMPGGIVRGDELSQIGSITEQSLEGVRLDACFLGIGGLTATDGATEFNLDDAQVKRKLIDISARTIVLADGAKFGEVAFSKVCDVDQIDELITDSSAPADEIEALRTAGVTVTVADA